MNSANTDKTWSMRSFDWWAQKEIDELDYEDITTNSFHAHFVDPWKPVKIVGACRHWSALSKWNDSNYLVERWGSADTLLTTPSYRGSLSSDDIEKYEKVEKSTLAKAIASGSEFLINSPIGQERDFKNTLCLPSELIEDLSEDKLVIDTKAPRFYPRRRMFLYRGGITPWHAHISDEHLTYQIVGEKDFVFLPPRQMHWRRRVQKLGAVPYCVTLKAGDAVYIPPSWYHAVAPYGHEYGATMAFAWAGSKKSHLKSLFSGNAIFTFWTLYIAAKNRLI